jgi:hypothetical protein
MKAKKRRPKMKMEEVGERKYGQNNIGPSEEVRKSVNDVMK